MQTSIDAKDKFKAILILGPPGSGKGTLGKFLSSAGNLFHLSSGDIFRGLDPDSPTGKIYHSYASRGNLVPDEVTIQVWWQYMQGQIATNRYFPEKQFLLLDGIPRTLSQAQILDQYIDVIKIIKLDMPNIEGLIKRIKRRALIEKRQDDADEEVLQNRMRVYTQETLGLISHYPKEVISIFNADQKPLEVLRDILVEMATLLSYPEELFK